MKEEKSIGRLFLDLWVILVIQTLFAAICLALIFELILPLSDLLTVPRGTFRDYLVYGLATVPLRMIFK